MNKTEWKELTPKQQWDVLVAMRGPDCHNSEPVKWVTTAVLRATMAEVMRVGGTINDDLKMVVVPANYHSSQPYAVAKDDKAALEKIPPHLRVNLSHFFQHVLEAAEVLNLPMLVVPAEIWCRAYEGANHTVQVMGKLVEGMDGVLNDKDKSLFYPNTDLKEKCQILKTHYSKLKGRY